MPKFKAWRMKEVCSRGNNIQRSQVAKCYGKVVELQGYKVFTILLPSHDFSPFPFKKTRRTMGFFFKGGKQKMKQTLEWTFNLGRGMYEEYCVLIITIYGYNLKHSILHTI